MLRHQYSPSSTYACGHWSSSTSKDRQTSTSGPRRHRPIWACVKCSTIVAASARCSCPCSRTASALCVTSVLCTIVSDLHLVSVVQSSAAPTPPTTALLLLVRVVRALIFAQPLSQDGHHPPSLYHAITEGNLDAPSAFVPSRHCTSGVYHVWLNHYICSAQQKSLK